MLGLLLIRGIVAGPAPSAPRPERAGGGLDPKEAAFAVRFARAYLADPSAAALAPYFAEGAVSLGASRPPRPGGSDLAQAEVSGFQELGDGRSILTVACDLRDTRTLYLAVPIARSEAGEVAALGAPSIVAEPGGGGGGGAPPPPAAPAGLGSLPLSGPSPSPVPTPRRSARWSRSSCPATSAPEVRAISPTSWLLERR